MREWCVQRFRVKDYLLLDDESFIIDDEKKESSVETHD